MLLYLNMQKLGPAEGLYPQWNSLNNFLIILHSEHVKTELCPRKSMNSSIATENFPTTPTYMPAPWP